MFQHPGPNLFEILGEVELRVALGRGPQWLVGLGDDHAQHDSAAAGNAAAAWFRQRCFVHACGLLCAYFGCRLVRAKRLEGCLARIALACPAGELDLRNQLRLDPGPILALARCARAAKWTSIAFETVQLVKKACRIARVEARADLSRVHEMIAAIDPDDQRAQIALVAAPAADHHFLPTATL